MKQRIRIHKAEPNTGVLNYSHLLDAPAGKHGFVEAKKGHLYFEDGTRARFLGFNVAARSNTPDHETADRMAERFASMGVNIIRLHAADAPVGEKPGSWSSCREAPLLDYASGTSRKFNPDGLERFDYFAAKLKEKGIYLHIDLIVARKFEEGDGMEYPGGAPSCIKRYCLYNQRMIELQKEYAKELKILNITLPKVDKIPAVRFDKAKELVSEKYNRRIRNPYDLEPEEELLIGRYFKEEYGSDFVFVTHYPSKKRPFYAMDDPADPKYTLSFDLLFKGLEVTTGGQRIHDYGEILKKMEKRGMDPEDIASYLMIFKYGMPPHGGLGIGLERLTMRLLDEQNVRETALFPRDVTRLEP